MVITGRSSWIVIIVWSNWIVITGRSNWIVITGRSNWIVMRVPYCWSWLETLTLVGYFMFLHGPNQLMEAVFMFLDIGVLGGEEGRGGVVGSGYQGCPITRALRTLWCSDVRS